MRVDPSKLLQVLAHILRNALRFSPPGATIRVDLESLPKAWAIAIRDQGPGMPEVHRRKLAHGFALPGATQPPTRKSSGVGLAICRRIMHAHGGTLTAENLTGGGCAVRITVPTP